MAVGYQQPLLVVGGRAWPTTEGSEVSVDESELTIVGLGEGALDDDMFGGEEGHEASTCSKPSKCRFVFPQVPSTRLFFSCTLKSSA